MPDVNVGYTLLGQCGQTERVPTVFVSASLLFNGLFVSVGHCTIHVNQRR